MSRVYFPDAHSELQAHCKFVRGRDYRWYGINLHALWRAKDEPEGDDPRSWLRLAEPLLLAFQDYYRASAWEATPTVQEDNLSIHPVEGLEMAHPDDTFPTPWLPGDLAADHQVALLYADYLDREAIEFIRLAGEPEGCSDDCQGEDCYLCHPPDGWTPDQPSL